MSWILQTLGAAVLALLLTEGLARAWIRTRKDHFVWKPNIRYLLETDPEVLPGMERRVRFEINAEGERGDPPPRPTDDGVYRVLVAGGSAAECYFLDQDTAWPGALQRILSRPENLSRLGCRRVHVGSVAKSLFGSQYLDELFAKILPRYPRLDLVVVMVGATDVVKWLGAGAPGTLPDTPAPADLVYEEHPRMPLGLHPKTWAISELLRRWRHAWLHPLEVRPRAGKKLGAARRMRREALEMRPTCPDPAPMLDRFERYFRSALLRAGSRARVLVVLQPCFDRQHTAEEEASFWGAGLGDPYHQKVTIYYEFGLVGRLMALMNARAARVAAELGVPCVDLMPVLDRDLATYYDFFHFTPKGSSQAAETIAAAVLDPASVRPEGVRS